MNSKSEIDVTALMDKPVWQMSGREFFLLAKYANADCEYNGVKGKQDEYCIGIRALAERLGCCESTIYTLKREGVLDGAVISRIGKKISFDVAMARDAANIYQNNKSNKRLSHD